VSWAVGMCFFSLLQVFFFSTYLINHILDSNPMTTMTATTRKLQPAHLEYYDDDVADDVVVAQPRHLH
jgi:hypothetical protein